MIWQILRGKRTFKILRDAPKIMVEFDFPFEVQLSDVETPVPPDSDLDFSNPADSGFIGH